MVKMKPFSGRRERKAFYDLSKADLRFFRNKFEVFPQQKFLDEIYLCKVNKNKIDPYLVYC